MGSLQLFSNILLFFSYIYLSLGNLIINIINQSSKKQHFIVQCIGGNYQVTQEFITNSTTVTGWSTVPSYSSCTKNLKCNNDYIFGGRYCFGNGSKAEKSFTIFHHWKIRIEVVFWYIDQWRTTDYIQMDYGTYQKKETTVTSSWSNYCGSSFYNDNTKSVDVFKENHFDRTLNIKFTSSNTYSSSSGSFAISKLKISADTCNPTCDECYGGDAPYQCQTCPTNANLVLYNSGLGFCKCKDGYYTNSSDVPCFNPYCMQCIACHSTCATCTASGSQSCIKCSGLLVSQYYSLVEVNNNTSDPKYQNSYCQASCYTSNYYVDKTTKECIRCHSSCATCIGALQYECKTCVTGYLDGTDSGGCVSNCAQGYYKDNNAKQCKKCSSNCLNCYDDLPNKCKDCKKDTYLYNGACLGNCPDGFYNNDTTRVCTACQAKCSTCVNNKSCSSCTGSKYFYQNDCLDTCPSGYYKKAGTKNQCLKCDATCLTCDEGTFQNCLSCDPAIGFLRNKMCSICLSNQYGNSTDQKCYPCNSSCLTCDGPTDTNCRSCSNSNYLTQNQCKTSCPSGFWPDITNNKCQPCDISCKTCTNSSSISCTSCSSTLFLKNNQCIEKCDTIREYPNYIKRECNPCHNSCYKCIGGDANQCTECSNNLYFYDKSCLTKCPNNFYGHKETLQCLDNCPQGQYKNDSNNMCDQCNPLCPICSSAGLTKCSKCNSPLFLNGEECIPNCPSGKYPKVSNQICTPCHSNCLECFGPTQNECNKCRPDSYFYENQCFTKCPVGTFGYKNTMECVVQCPAGLYGETKQNLCIPCNSNCSLCYGQQKSQCKACNEGFFLLKDTCDNCPPGYYQNKEAKTCEVCSQFCQSCDGPSNNNCLSCSIGNYFVKERKFCYSQCPTPYFSEEFNQDCVLKCNRKDQFPNEDTRRCENCNPACQRCTAKLANTCSICSPNYFYLKEQNLCTKQCPDGFFENELTMNCEHCDITCAKCRGKEQDQCTKCSSSLVLHQNKCIDSCPDNLYKDEEKRQCVTDCTENNSNKYNNNTTMQCSKCHFSCARCTGPSSNECQKCNHGYYKYKSSCLSQCNQGTYPTYTKEKQNQNTDDCQSCHQSCSECYGPSDLECRICKSNYFKLEIKNTGDISIQCTQKCPSLFIENKEKMICDVCPISTYLVDGRCEKCHYGCQTCFGPQKDQCIQCFETRGQGEDRQAENGLCKCNEGFTESFNVMCKIEPKMAETSRKVVSASAYTAGACSAAVGLIAKNMFSMYSVVEVAQFTSYFSHVNITFPMNADKVFSALYVSHFTSTFSPSNSKPNLIQYEKNTTSENKNRVLSIVQSVSNGNIELWQIFLPLVILNILSWIIVFVLNLFSTHMKIKYDNTKLFERLRVYSQYSLPIQIFIRTSQESFLYIFLALMRLSQITIFDMINIGYLLIITLVIFTITIRAAFLEMNIQTNEKGEIEYIQAVQTKKQTIHQPHQFRTLWYLFKEDKYSRNYYLAMMVSKLLFVLAIVFLSQAKWQALSAFMIKIVATFYILAARPFKEKQHNAISIFNEFLQAALSFTVFLYVTSDSSHLDTFGWLILVELLLIFSVNCFYVLISFIILVKVSITSYFENKQKKQKINVCNESVDQLNCEFQKRKNILTNQPSQFDNLNTTQYKDDRERSQTTKNQINFTDIYNDTKFPERITENVIKSPRLNQSKLDETMKNQSYLHQIEEESQVHDHEYADIVEFPLTVITKKIKRKQSTSPQRRTKIKSHGAADNQKGETESPTQIIKGDEIESPDYNNSIMEFNKTSQFINQDSKVQENYDMISFLDEENNFGTSQIITTNPSPTKISSQGPYISTINLENKSDMLTQKLSPRSKTPNRSDSSNQIHIILSQSRKQSASPFMLTQDGSPFTQTRKGSQSLNKTVFKLEKVQNENVLNKSITSKRYDQRKYSSNNQQEVESGMISTTPKQKKKKFQQNNSNNNLQKDFKIVRNTNINEIKKVDLNSSVQGKIEEPTDQNDQQFQCKSIIEFVKSKSKQRKSSSNSPIKNIFGLEAGSSVYIQNSQMKENKDDFEDIQLQTIQSQFIQQRENLETRHLAYRQASKSCAISQPQIKAQKIKIQRASSISEDNQNNEISGIKKQQQSDQDNDQVIKKNAQLIKIGEQQTRR